MISKIGSNLIELMIKPLGANFIKWSNTLKQFIGKSVFDHFVGLALKGSNSFPISVVKRSRLAFDIFPRLKLKVFFH